MDRREFLERVDAFGATRHWRMPSSGAAVTQRLAGGVNGGTLSGTIEYIAQSLAQEDSGGRTIGVANNGQMQIASASVFDAPAGCWLVLAQFDRVDFDEQQIVNRWETGNSAGAFDLKLRTDGSLIAHKQAADNVTRTVTTAAGLIVPGEPHLIGISWGSEGLQILLDTAVVASESTPTTDWTGAPGLPIRVGRWHNGVTPTDGIIGDVFFGNSQPSAAQIAELYLLHGISLLTGGDLGQVQDSGTISLDPRNFGHFAGTLTPTITTQGTNCTASVAGEGVNVFGVNVDTSDTFAITVVDARGTHGPATFTVEVTAAPGSSNVIAVENQAAWNGNPSDAAKVTEAFGQALSAAAAIGTSGARGVIELQPGRTYIVRTTNGARDNPGACLTARSNVEIRTQGQPLRGSVNQATIKIESWSGKSGQHNQVIVLIDGVSNFKLGWLRLHGNKNTIASSPASTINFTQGQNGAIHNITHHDGTGFRMEQVISEHAVCDGIYWRNDSGNNPNALVVDSTFTRCRRQGASIIKLGSSAGGVDQLVFRRCTFSDTGDFGSGDVIGQQPAAGVDIEPNSESQGIYGLTMDTCTFSGNLGSVYNNGNTGGFSDGAGFLGQAKSTMRWLRLLDCTFTNNRKGLVLKATGNPVHSDTLVENVVVTGSTSSNNISLESAGGDGGTLVNWDIVNPKIGSAGTGAVTVEATLSASGHSVDVRKGSFNPTISNPGGRSTFTLRNGFP